MASHTVYVIGFIFLVLASVSAIPYQAHSFNDIDSWPQLLAKGVDYLKVDFVLATQDACKSYSTWNGTASDCDVYQNVTYCCIGLRGDTSSAPNLHDFFNTTNDLLFFVRDNAGLFQATPVYMALDFDHMVNWNIWQSNVRKFFEEFLVELQAVIVNLQLKLYPVLDYTANSWLNAADIACQTSCTPEQMMMSNLPYVAQSSSFPPLTTDPKHRFQILNAPVSDFSSLCTASFPDQNRSTAHPYLFWEPSNQKDIVTLLQQYQSCPSVPASHKDISTGLRVTSNLEPEMFEVYASSVIPTGLNALVRDKTNVNPFVAVFPADPTSPNPAVLFVFTMFTSSLSGITYMEVCLFNGVITDPAHAPVIYWSPYPSVNHDKVTSVSASGNFLLIGSDSGRFSFFQWEEKAGNLSLLLNGTWSHSADIQPNTTSLFCHDSDCFAAILYVPTTSQPHNNTCQLWFEVVAMKEGLPLVANLVCLTQLPVSSSSLSLALVTWEPTRIFSGIVVYQSMSPQAPTSVLYGDFISIGFGADGKVNKLELVNANDPAPARFDFGSSPSVHVLPIDGVLYVLEAHTDGSCQFGFMINNGDYNHCQISSTGQPASLASVPALLNYNFAPLANFQKLFVTRQPASSCSRLVFHSKYDVGLHPSVSLYASLNSPKKIRMIEIHDAGSLGGAVSPLIGAVCGAPSLQDGLVMDAFSLPQSGKIEKLGPQ